MPATPHKSSIFERLLRNTVPIIFSGRKQFIRLRPLVCQAAKGEIAVKVGRSPFILTLHSNLALCYICLNIPYLKIFPSACGVQLRAAVNGLKMRSAATDFQVLVPAQIQLVCATLCFKDKIQLFLFRQSQRKPPSRDYMCRWACPLESGLAA